ncbi:MAG: hypothetical protein LC768_06970 [Acidobacteria bacterium]|nr:hypothetical protein [Acidobacteriota bacterium]MCA1638064.1 hypothetical protein [Acidobacteriota bacterium]
MSKFTNPLENIKIASPCKANWEEMYGNERKRFCSDCKLNVYNLSGMTLREAENLILQSEGRLCVRFYKRADGSILTKDCLVGWQAIKRNISKMTTAFAPLIFAILSGIGLTNYFAKSETEMHNIKTIAITNENYTTGVMAIDDSNVKIKGTPMMGDISVLDNNENIPVAGGLTNIKEVRQQIKQKRRR